MGDQMIVVYERFLGGSMRLIKATTVAGDQGLRVKQLVPDGSPYWAWPSVPSGRVIACDFTNAPLCSQDIAVNNANIGNITIDPMDVLTYE